VEAALRSALKDAPAQVLHRFWNNAPAIKVQEIVPARTAGGWQRCRCRRTAWGSYRRCGTGRPANSKLELRPRGRRACHGRERVDLQRRRLDPRRHRRRRRPHICGTRAMGRCCVRSRTIRTSPGSGSGRQSRAGSRRPHTTRDYTCGMLAPGPSCGAWIQGVAAQLAFSGDGRRIAAAVEPGSLCLIDTSNASAGGEPVCMPRCSARKRLPQRSDRLPSRELLLRCPRVRSSPGLR